MAGDEAPGQSCCMPSAAPIKVFLADDSALICDRVEGILAAAGMTVVGRGDSPQACYDRILQSRPDVVVLDVQLDGGAGMEVLRSVRLVSPRVAFVVFTNNSGPAYRRRYLAAGACQFVDKSTEIEMLAPAVARASTQSAH